MIHTADPTQFILPRQSVKLFFVDIPSILPTMKYQYFEDEIPDRQKNEIYLKFSL